MTKTVENCVNLWMCLLRVGKSSFMNRYVNHRFTNAYRATVGTDFFSKRTVLDGETVILQVTPTSSCRRRRSWQPPLTPCVCGPDLGHSWHREVPVSGYTPVQREPLLHAGVRRHFLCQLWGPGCVEEGVSGPGGAPGSIGFPFYSPGQQNWPERPRGQSAADTQQLLKKTKKKKS